MMQTDVQAHANGIDQEDEFALSHQRRYWQEVVQLKAHVEYLHLYHLGCEKWNNRINIFLAIATSGSIAAWAVWNRLQWVWASVIALSHVVQAVRYYLPFEKRKKGIAGLSSELVDILLDAERNWYYVAEGQKTSEEIHQLIMDLKSRKTKALSRYFRDEPLPTKQKLLDEAAFQTELYFNKHYPV